MEHCIHEIDGLSSSARPFAIGSSSFFPTYSKSEHDSSWADYTLDFSFLSSDDQRSALDDDVEKTKEGEDKIVSSGKVSVSPNPRFTKLPEVLIKSTKVAGNDKLDLSCANASVVSEKSFTDFDQDEFEEDTPCWIGTQSLKTMASGTKSVTPKRTTDDLSGFNRLNPLAPQFIPSNSKRNLEKDGKKCEKNSSLSLKKSLSSTFPSSSGEIKLTDFPEDGRNDATRRENILTHNADENSSFVSRDNLLSKTLSMSDSRTEFEQSKRLDPLAPVFVPSTAKLSPSVHEKQGASQTNTHSTSPQTSSDNKSLNKVTIVTCSGEVGDSFKSQNGVHELGSTSSYTPWIKSDVGITDYAKLGGSSNKSHGERRLNPLAPQFSLANTKAKAYGYEKNQAAEDLPLVVNNVGLSHQTGNWEWDHNVVDAELAQSSEYVEHLLPRTSRGSSSFISPKADCNFGSSKWFAVEPKSKLSVKGNKGFKHILPFHEKTAASSSSSDLKAFSGPSPKMDGKKLLTTMHGLSELLAHPSESSPNAEELDLIHSIVQNLNLYKNSSLEQAGNESATQGYSHDLTVLPNERKLSISDLQLPRANNMTVDLGVKRKGKYSVVSKTVPGSRLYEYGAAIDNRLDQIVARSGYQQNHQGEEQISAQALFYKSLWLKAEADRCLMEYETCL